MRLPRWRGREGRPTVHDKDVKVVPGELPTVAVVDTPGTDASEPEDRSHGRRFPVKTADDHGGLVRARQVPVERVALTDGVGEGQQYRPAIVSGAGNVRLVPVGFHQFRRPDWDRGCGSFLAAGEGDERKEDESHA